MSTEITPIERVLVAGDLSALTEGQRLEYYRAVCESLKINPLTRPFEYLRLNGRLILYATRAATDQLRATRGISVIGVEIKEDSDTITVIARGRAADGREDTEIGVVPIAGLRGDALANARMKAVTKAKRRLTLSLAGLGWLDETEIETIRPTAAPPPELPASAPPAADDAAERATLRARITELAAKVKAAMPNYVDEAEQEAQAALRQARAVYARDSATADDLRAVVARLESLL